MLQIRMLMAPVATALLVLSGCSDSSRRLETPVGLVDVIEAHPVAPLDIEPLPALPVAPEPVYLSPLPLPVRHAASAATSPAGTRLLGEVQSVEVDVEVEGGALGTREISVLFVSPQGLVWQRQATLIAASGWATRWRTSRCLSPPPSSPTSTSPAHGR